MERSSLGLWSLMLLACWPLPTGLAGENLVNFLGGDNKCEGQIQLLYDGQWGLMCGDGLGMQEASVICRQLGCGSVHSISQYILTPEEMKQPWLYGAQCRGEEATLWECLLGPWGPLSGCKCQCVAVIICSGGTTRQIRLADGSSPCAGIPEATGLSGLALRCDLQKEEAGVLCRQLECGTALQWSRAHHGADRKQEEKYIKCQGTEPDILHCQINVNFLEQCDLLTYTQVMCTGHVEARLLGGTHPCEGRLEVLRGLTWGTVCYDDLDLPMANVVCRELGCGTAVSTLGSSHFGHGSGPVWTEAFRCVGNESLLFHCPKEPGHQCGHDQDAALTCSEEKFRLVNGSSSCEGRVELRVKEDWQPLCAAHWDLADAMVLCHQLNCGYAVAIPQEGHFGNVSDLIWTDVFHCVGTEPHLLSCPASTLGAQACTLENSASVICSGLQDALRLRDGQSHCDGRVEVFLDGVWGRVLDNAWDLHDAAVVCRQLGCGEAQRAYGAPAPDHKTVPVGLSLVRCSGSETHLSQCNVSVSQVVPAGTLQDAGVVCSGSLRIRLAEGKGRCAGRVEVFYQGTWGTVCDDAWDLRDAHVVCRQLGCGYALSAPGAAHFGAGTGRIWMDELGCLGEEAALWECQSGGWGQQDCGHKEDAGVVCSEFTDVRLQEHSQPCTGRLEVFYNGTWGGVCQSLSAASLRVLCGQLGCGSQGQLLARPRSSSTLETLWLKSIQCRDKHDRSLWQCPSEPWNRHSCLSGEEAWLVCTEMTEVSQDMEQIPNCSSTLSCPEEGALRVFGGDNGCSGRVEFWHRGSWGTVCDDSWDLADAEVACRQLGCGPAIAALRHAAFGPGSGPIWLDEVGCRGSETSLGACQAEPWGYGDCSHKEDAGVHCLDISTTEASGSSLAPPSAPEVWTLPEIACLVLGCLLGIVFLVLASKWYRSRAISMGSGVTGQLPSDAIYEYIETVPMEERAEGPAATQSLVQDEDYDDAEEPEDSPGEDMEAGRC
ncbi:scavenger receptor cysteine-rich domain-containing protein SCART1 [Peromyscus californicus insignis]|uniref:scavenger receptor cysteine-rich domain-containing protein SCART1 n=1 Tax=Peromyscus californicus insignis TaxID=564181 RepID=UPI0022A6B798|nr:scavenger receptor cysteine-rich domain-containing protein SCART1 [Peromyscus californicus insignis]XP_052569537.1 scavenger receptor cysteine-rich domain-containing protein SCART1 [Peromyscus californicus insignis]